MDQRVQPMAERSDREADSQLTAEPDGARLAVETSRPGGGRHRPTGFRLTRMMIALLLVVISTGILLWMMTHSSPLEQGMEALRQAYRRQRPVEMRVSGQFAYAPYEPARQAGSQTGVDELQRASAGASLAGQALASGDASAHQALARFYLYDREAERAEAELTALLRNHPRFAKLHKKTDFCRHSLDDEPEGDVDHAELHNDLGVALFQMGHYANALRHVDIAVALDRGSPEALFNRALIQQRLMLLIDAQEDWTRYLSRETDRGWSREARGHLDQIEALISADWSDIGQRVEEEFNGAYRRQDEAKVKQLVIQYPNWVELLAANRWLPRYVENRRRGHQQAAREALERAEYIGHLLATLKDDPAVAQAVAFYRRLPRQRWDAHLRAYRQYRSGRALERRRDHQAAINLLHRAAAALARLGDLFYAERAELIAADILYENQKEYLRCHDALRRLLPGVKQRGHKRYEIHALSTLGYIYAVLGNHSQSLKLLRRAQALEASSNLDGSMANILNHVGINQKNLGQVDRAIETFERALQAGFRSTRPLIIETIYQNLAWTYMGLDDYSMAARYQDEVLFRKERASEPDPYYLSGTLTHTGQIYTLLEDRDQARRYLDRALQVNQSIKDPSRRREADVFTLSRLGRLVRSSGDLKRAANIYDRCRALLGQKQEYRLEVYFDSARTQLALGHYGLARQEFDQAIDLFEAHRTRLEQEQERNSFFTRGKDIYDDMVLLLYHSLDQPEAAFEYSERSKARSFLDLVSADVHLETEGEQTELLLRGHPQPRSFDEIARNLPADVSLLHYAVTRERVIMWLVNRGQPLRAAESPISAEDVRQAVGQFLTAIEQRQSLERIRARAEYLYRALIEPLAAYLEWEKTLCIIPDGVLHYLPFAALVSPATGQYLVQQVPVSTCPSASIFLHCLELMRQKTPLRSRLLAIGNPATDARLGLTPLPLAEREVEKIAAEYPASETLLQEEALEDRILRAMPHYDAIHFAAHGLIREREPMFSALALAPRSQQPQVMGPAPAALRAGHEDGLLQVFELYELQLPGTSLVVLSGCETGLGEFFKGEGLIGLARPFIHAGVPTLLVSLWPILDGEATVDLMVAFHHRWQLGGQTAAALRQAQLQLLNSRQYQHPYYWAPFLVIGSYR